ncbi:MAG TPA: DinB family protein [Abditibacteriaceae bacterium]|nr:DinB family protein [Abditibacteriaceae bacterium]
MNEKFYGVCDTMPDELRREDKGAWFKSVHGTLGHLLLADRVWLGRFTRQPFVVQSLDQELYHDWNELKSERAQTDDAIDAWLASLSDEDLKAPFLFKGITTPFERTFPLWVVAAHLFNHQTHHRGQLTTVMEQLGYDSGVTDLLLAPGMRLDAD